MDISTTATAGSPAHPNLQLWDKLYQGKKDECTNEKADKELFKFHDILTDGKIGLDILVPMCALQKQKWKFHTKTGVFISSHIAPGFWCLQPTEMSGLFTP